MKKNVIHLLLFFPFFVLSQEVCNDYYACNYAYEGDCQYPEEYYDCNNNCLNDVDNDNDGVPDGEDPDDDNNGVWWRSGVECGACGGRR